MGKKIIFFDLEGVLMRDSNFAKHIMEKYVPNGKKIFNTLDKLDDIMSIRNIWPPGQTLAMIVPLLNKYGVTSGTLLKEAKTFSIDEDAIQLISLLKKDNWVIYILSNAYFYLVPESGLYTKCGLKAFNIYASLFNLSNINTKSYAKIIRDNTKILNKRKVFLSIIKGYDSIDELIFVGDSIVDAPALEVCMMLGGKAISYNGCKITEECSNFIFTNSKSILDILKVVYME